MIGCQVITPCMDITVYQVSGWEQAQLFPDTESWAAPFTWCVVGSAFCFFQSV